MIVTVAVAVSMIAVMITVIVISGASNKMGRHIIVVVRRKRLGNVSPNNAVGHSVLVVMMTITSVMVMRRPSSRLRCHRGSCLPAAGSWRDRSDGQRHFDNLRGCGLAACRGREAVRHHCAADAFCLLDIACVLLEGSSKVRGTVHVGTVSGSIVFVWMLLVL